MRELERETRELLIEDAGLKARRYKRQYRSEIGEEI
jgi:hypothetical protein